MGYFRYSQRWNQFVQRFGMSPENTSQVELVNEERDRELEDYLSNLQTGAGGSSLLYVHDEGDGYSGFTISAGTVATTSLIDTLGSWWTTPDGTTQINVRCSIIAYPADGTVGATVDLQSFLTYESGDDSLLTSVVDGGNIFDFYTLTNEGVFELSSTSVEADSLVFHINNASSMDIFVYGIQWIIEFTSLGGHAIPPPF